MILVAALVVAAAEIAWAARQIVVELRAQRGASGARMKSIATLLALFAPALSETQHDARAFLVWQPITLPGAPLTTPAPPASP